MNGADACELRKGAHQGAHRHARGIQRRGAAAAVEERALRMEEQRAQASDYAGKHRDGDERRGGGA